MYRESRNIRSPLLFAVAILTAISLGGMFFSAVACTQDAVAAASSTGQLESHEAASAVACPDRVAHAWRPVLVQLHKQGSYLDAKRFAARIKRHLGRRFAKRKEQFEKHQAQIERQRRAYKHSKAHNKARQFAAARRHAAQHAHKHGRALAAKLKMLAARKLKHREHAGSLASGSSAQHAVHWRSLWRHGARNDAQTPSD